MLIKKKEQDKLISLEEKSFFERVFIKSFLVFNQKISNLLILFCIISASIWLVLFLIFEKNSLPGGLYFSLWTLVVCSQIFGFIFEKLRLPPLLGIYRFYFNRLKSKS